jgi:hypothetical protein
VAQHFRRVDQQRIAGAVSLRVVDHLQFVEFDHEHRGVAFQSLATRLLDPQRGFPPAPPGQAGQVIGERGLVLLLQRPFQRICLELLLDHGGRPRVTASTSFSWKGPVRAVPAAAG